MNGIIKTTQALEDYNILLKGVTKAIKMKQKNKKGDFQEHQQALQDQSCQGNLLSGRGTVRAGSGNKKGKGIVRAGHGKEWDF